MQGTRPSLIQKIISKGAVLTPFEVIHLKYLIRKEVLNDLTVKRGGNSYLSVREANKSVSPIIINFLASRATEKAPELFQSYSFSYESILRHDESSEKLGFKGLMLLTQLRLIRSEYCLWLDESKSESLFDFQSYSYLHQENTTFAKTLKTLGETFEYFIRDIDNILTLNYYLNRLIALDELSCIRILKMWLSKPKKSINEEDFEYLNGAYMCCESENIQFILKENHQNYVDSLNKHIHNLPADFGESSLQYVKDTISGIVNLFES